MLEINKEGRLIYKMKEPGFGGNPSVNTRKEKAGLKHL